MGLLPGTVAFSVAKVPQTKMILTGGGRTIWEIEAVACAFILRRICRRIHLSGLNAKRLDSVAIDCLKGEFAFVSEPLNMSRRFWIYLSSVTMLSCLGTVLLFPSAAATTATPPHPDPGRVVTIKINAHNGVPIHRLLYGINYDWNAVPAARIKAFAQSMRYLADATIVRYPGGWNAEAFNWNNNTERPWSKVSKVPGANPNTILKLFPEMSFITPSAGAIKNSAEAASVAELSANLVQRYGSRVRFWEIGNEWWLQRGGKKNKAVRERNLKRYAHLLDVVVPEMKKADPAIRIFATAEWQNPADMRRLRYLTGAGVWKQIYGVSLHTYCGIIRVLCSSLPAAIAKIRAASGKSFIYSSEWAVVRHDTPRDFGIRNASYTVDAIRDMAFAGIQLGAYWPPVREIPALAFESANYKIPFATGIVFGWMSRFYEGLALRVAGDTRAVAALDNGKLTVIVPSYSERRTIFRISLRGTAMRRIVSARVLFSDAPNARVNAIPATIATLPVRFIRVKDGETYVQFTLNPGIKGRGSAYEIARVVLANR